MKYYESEDFLQEFYNAIASGSNEIMKRVHIPRSEVIYVRAAIEADTGIRYPTDRIERAMYLEGMLKASDCFEPERKREWEEN